MRREWIAAALGFWATGAAAAAPCADAPKCAEECKQKVGDSCQLLALMYDNGDFVAMDHARAEVLAEQACSLDSWRGCDQLATWARESKSKTAAAKAARAYQADSKACDAGDASACGMVTLDEAGGMGTRKDEKRSRATWKKARPLLEKACEEQDAFACDVLATGAGVDDKERRELHTRSAALWEARCEDGEYDTCWRMVNAHSGSGDIPVTGFEKACGRGDGTACRMGSVVDKSAAQKWLEKSCDTGDVQGCAWLGRRLYATDRKRAFQLLEKACSQDHRQCKEFGDVMGESSASYYQEACDAGRLNACTLLAFRAESGIGEPANARKAATLLVDACDRGDNDACLRLQEAPKCEKGDADACVVASTPYENLGLTAMQRRYMGKACDAETLKGNGMLCASAAMLEGTPAADARRYWRRSCDAGWIGGCGELEGSEPKRFTSQKWGFSLDWPKAQVHVKRDDDGTVLYVFESRVVLMVKPVQGVFHPPTDSKPIEYGPLHGARLQRNADKDTPWSTEMTIVAAGNHVVLLSVPTEEPDAKELLDSLRIRDGQQWYPSAPPERVSPAALGARVTFPEGAPQGEALEDHASLSEEVAGSTYSLVVRTLPAAALPAKKADAALDAQLGDRLRELKAKLSSKKKLELGLNVVRRWSARDEGASIEGETFVVGTRLIEVTVRTPNGAAPKSQDAFFGSLTLFPDAVRKMMGGVETADSLQVQPANRADAGNAPASRIVPAADRDAGKVDDGW